MWDSSHAFTLRRMTPTQRAKVVEVIVKATNANYPDRDAAGVATVIALSSRYHSTEMRWLRENPESTIRREINRIQGQNWLAARVYAGGTQIAGSLPPKNWMAAARTSATPGSISGISMVGYPGAPISMVVGHGLQSTGDPLDPSAEGPPGSSKGGGTFSVSWRASLEDPGVR